MGSGWTRPRNLRSQGAGAGSAKQSEESQSCRLCKRSKETISHITQDCNKIIAVKSKISELLRKMGLKTSAIDGIRTWVFRLH